MEPNDCSDRRNNQEFFDNTQKLLSDYLQLFENQMGRFDRVDKEIREVDHKVDELSSDVSKLKEVKQNKPSAGLMWSVFVFMLLAAVATGSNVKTIEEWSNDRFTGSMANAEFAPIKADLIYLNGRFLEMRQKDKDQDSRIQHLQREMDKRFGYLENSQ